MKFWRGGCWVDGRVATVNGYVQVQPGGRAGRKTYRHRVVYEILVGPIPEGYEIDHLCRNRACYNPGHMEVVTHEENMQRMPPHAGWFARQSHCKYGHEFDYWNGFQNVCKACNREKTARYRARKKQEGDKR